MSHGYLHHIVGGMHHLQRQPVAFGTHNDSQSRLSQQALIVQPHAIVSQGHGGRLEAQGLKLFHTVGPSPRHQKHIAHRYPDGPAIKRIARIARKQHSVYAQCCRTAKDSTNIGGIHHIIYHHHPTRTLAHSLGRWLSRPSEGTQHTAGELIAREPGQHVTRSGVHGKVVSHLTLLPHVLYDVQQLARVALYMSAFAQQFYGHISCPQSHKNHLGALGNEERLFRMQPIAQLSLSKPAENAHPLIVCRRYLYNFHLVSVFHAKVVKSAECSKQVCQMAFLTLQKSQT